MAPECWVNLQKVSIKNWLDEDGVEVGSAVVVQADGHVPVKKPSKLETHRKTFENAWWASGTEERNGQPYLSRSAMTDYLMQKMGLSEASAKVYIKPSSDGKPIADLLVAEIIEAFEAGWIVIDGTQASALLIRKSER